MHVLKTEVYEILAEFRKATNKAGRKEVLLKYSNVAAFKDVLRGTFDDSLQFLLPEGAPPYTPNIPESVPSTLLKQHKQFGYFVKGGPGAKLPSYKREKMFINLLESVHPEDAEIVISMVSKTSPVKFLTKKLVQEAFPNLIKT
jgi:hypothetical protein